MRVFLSDFFLNTSWGKVLTGITSIVAPLLSSALFGSPLIASVMTLTANAVVRLFDSVAMIFAQRFQGISLHWIDWLSFISSIMKNSPQIYNTFRLSEGYPSLILLFAPFLTDGLEVYPKNDRPFVYRILSIGYAFILLAVQGIYGTHMEFFEVLYVLGFTIIGLSGSEVANENLKKRNPSHINTILSALAEIATGAILLFVLQERIQKINLGLIVSASIFLIIGSMGFVAASTNQSSHTKARFAVLNNFGAHLTESATTGVRHWADTCQIITGVVQISLSFLDLLFRRQETIRLNRAGDPKPEEVR